MREADGDGMAGFLKVVDEGVDVGGGVCRRRAIVVGKEDVHLGDGEVQSRFRNGLSEF